MLLNNNPSASELTNWVVLFILINTSNEMYVSTVINFFNSFLSKRFLFILQGELKIQVEQGAFQSKGPNGILGEAF